ncbi:MAG: glycosyltransferase family 39 protein [Anaerolineales bacterium]|nr:glycosyltransferase family 39 protein [Anaerolineales bacterium]
MPPTSSHHAIRWSIHRGWLAAVGVVLLVWGQIRIADEAIPPTPPSPLAIFLTDKLHLSIPSIQNVLDGAPFLLTGGLLIVLALRKLTLLPPEPSSAQGNSFEWHALRPLWPWFAGGIALLGALLWQIRYLSYYNLMILEWLLAPLFFGVGLLLWDIYRKIDLSPKIGRRDVVWMLGLFTLSLLIGVYRLQGLPDMLIGDEGSFWLAARDIAQGKFQPPIFGSGVYTFPVLSSIGQSLVLKLFGIDLWGWRFSSVLAGALTVFPLYLLARDAFDRKMAITSSLVLATSPYFLAFSRLGYNNIQALFITTLTLYWLYIGAKRTSALYLFLAGCAAGFGFYTYFAARMALVIGLLFLGSLWLTRTLSFRHVVWSSFLLLFGFIFVTTPYLLYVRLNDPAGMAFKVFESVFFNTFNGRLFFSEEELTEIAPLFTISGNELFYHPRLYLILIVRGILRTWLVFQKPWLISEHFIAAPLAGSIGIIFYLLGFGALFSGLRQPRRLLLLLWYLVIFFGLSALNTVPPRHTHMVNIIPLLALLIAIGLRGVSEALRLLFHLRQRLLLPASGLLTALVALGGLYDYFILMPRRYTPQPDQIISWAGLYTNNERLIYLYETEEEALRTQPFLINEFRQTVDYRAFPYDQWHPSPSCDNTPCLIFYLPHLRSKVEPLLSQAWGHQLIRRTFYNPDGIPVLAVGMNTPFTFERDRSAGQVLAESYLRPSLLVLIACLAIVWGMIAFLPASLTSRLPRRFEAISRWFSAQPEAAPETDSSIIFLEEDFEGSKPPSPPPPEPPPWIEEVFPPTQTSLSRFSLQIHSLPKETGREIYVRLYLPAWKIAQGWSIHIPPLEFPAPIPLSTAVGSALLAQVLLLQQQIWGGVFFYLLAAAGLIFWLYRHPKWGAVLVHQVRIRPRAELALALFLLIAIAFSRFYDLGYRVYGLEADETKWTAQAWLSVLLNENLGEFAGMHYQYVPLDFWIRAGFLRLFGLNFLSARIQSACYSILASVFLYLLVRRLTNSPAVAWLSAALYAFSYVELNASHQALHNTTIEPWLLASVYFLLLALQDNKIWQYQVVGLALALGMLTYETFYPTVLTGLVGLLGIAFHQLRKRQANARQWLRRFLLVLWPIILVYLTFTQRYLQSRHGYHFGWLETATENGQNWSGALAFLGQNIRLWLKSLFMSVTMDDSLLRWNGPFISYFVIPFVVLGCVYSIFFLRRPYFFLLPLWYFLNVLSAPILLGSVWPRVLYTSLPPLMIWGALGLWIFFGALRAWLDPLRPYLTHLVFVLTLGIIFVSNYSVFIHKIGDPIDRVKRRELADLTDAAAQQADLLLLPYFPAQNDSVELENHVILFSVAHLGEPVTAAAQRYERVPYNDLLLALWENRYLKNIAIVHDRSARSLQEERQQVMETFRHCYPAAHLERSGQFFDVYILDEQTLQNPRCYEAPPPTPIEPTADMKIPTGQPLTFAWEDNLPTRSGFLFTLEKKRPNVYFLEAEDLFTGNGWYWASEFAADFTGKGFLLDNWMSKPVSYTLELAEAGRYRLWVRSYKREYNDQQNYLAVGHKTLPFAGNDIPRNEWVWESLGVFDLPAGPLTLTMSRSYGNDPQYSVFIDSLLLTPDLVNPPGPESVWYVLLTHSMEGTSSRLTIHETLSPGRYRWNVRVFDGDKLIDSDGELGIVMPPVEFEIMP